MVIASVLGPMWFVLGLSQLLYASQWGKLIDGWMKDHLQLVPMMLLAGILGLIMIRMHNVWEWNLWIVVTIAGWGAFLKSVIYFLLPGSTTVNMMKFGKNMIYLGGLVATVLGGLLTYNVYFV